MTTESPSGQRAGRFRFRRPSGWRMAAMGSVLCLAAGTGIGMAAYASAAPTLAAHTLAAPGLPSSHFHKPKVIVACVGLTGILRVLPKGTPCPGKILVWGVQGPLARPSRR
jgi:hypothetical protein